MTKAAELAKMGEVLTNSQIGGRRNIIINGAMEVAQRGTSASSKTSSDYYTCDRWRTEASGATFNTSQQSNTASDMATTGAKHFLRMEVTTGNNNSGISQKIEAKNIRQFKGEKLTLSFYAKGTNPNGGSFDVVRFIGNNSAAATSETSSLTVTSSFVKYTYTFDYPDEGSITMTDATARMALSFLQPNGDTSTNAWTLDITSVQLEVGSKSTPFEHRSFGEELALCQRYYSREEAATGADYKRYGTGSWSAATVCEVLIPLSTPMRTTPTLETTGTVSDYAVYSAGAVDASTELTITNDADAGTDNRAVSINITTSGGGVAGEAGTLLGNNDTDNFLALDAEL